MSRAAEKLPQVAPPAPKHTQGKLFANDLHISEMSNVLIRELQEIITRQQEKELIYFLARYRPEFIELEEYLSRLRSSYFSLLGKPSNLASEGDKVNAINALDLDSPPSCIDIGSITKTNLRYLVEKNLKTSNRIDLNFMERFGGLDFIENFQVYTQLTSQQPITLHVDSNHQYRPQLETFVSTGIALQGRKIPLKERLEALSFTQLKEMATELKLTEQFHTKSEAAEALAKMPGSAVHLSIIYESDDIFYLQAEPVDAFAIEDEWSMLRSYATLLIGSLKNSFVSFDEAAVT
ncbi:MAG: hypothetical protein PVJ39_19870 [Gammaproteobacteria bacterium]